MKNERETRAAYLHGFAWGAERILIRANLRSVVSYARLLVESIPNMPEGPVREAARGHADAVLCAIGEAL